jgi:DNA invertase Pin-like site-specific DNA recombinase
MPEPLVEVSWRSDDSEPAAQARVLSKVVTIATRPQYTPADAKMLRRVVAAPRPGPAIDWGGPVRRTKPARRRNTVESRFLTAATRELFERLGKTERRVVNGSVVLRWDLGEGDGMVVARKSSEDSKSGETIGGQLDAAISYCDHNGHKPRIVLAVLNMSGRAHFESRQDFNEVFEAFERKEADWVCYRSMDRLARSVTWTALFVHYLREYGIGLHVAQLNRALDLHNHFDMAQLWVMAMSAEMDWANSFDRLQAALSRQMRDAGRGWANTGGFGFTRDEQGFVVVNDEQWPFVLLIHELYASLGSEAQVRRVLSESHGLTLSTGLVHRVLHDERFITGRIKTKDPNADGGVRWDTVHLDRPVPRALWERNQLSLAARRGRTVRTPEGSSLLRGIPVLHASCMDQDRPSASLNRLGPETTKGKRTYRHRGPGRDDGYIVPEHCRGYSIEADILEPAVIQALRHLLKDNSAMHRAIAYARTGATTVDTDGGVLSGDDRDRLQLEKRSLERHREGLWQQHLDRIRQGKPDRTDLLEEQINRVDAEVRSIEIQIETDRILRLKRKQAAEVPRDILKLLTDQTPENPEQRLRRWSIVQQLVSQVIVHDVDGGLRVELFGPLVGDAAVLDWTPATALADDPSDVRPSVPEPFTFPPKRERLSPVFRWLSAEFGADEQEEYTPELFAQALLELSSQFPTGRLYAREGIGRERWDTLEGSRLHIVPIAVHRMALAEGTSERQWTLETLGVQHAVARGRVRVESRDEAIIAVAVALADGFNRGSNCSRAADAFGRDKPYAFNGWLLGYWASHWGFGSVDGLLATARQVLEAGALQ